MNSRTGKQIGLLAVFVAMLGALAWGISHFSGAIDGQKRNSPAPKLDAAKLAARWPEIAAHAAAPARGPAGARYTLAEFGDFQCPQCGKARPVLEGLLARSAGQANLLFLHRPFPNIHPYAIPAGAASAAAAAQGRFWPMYDVLYSHQDDLEPGFYPAYAAEAKLDPARFKAAEASGNGKARIAAASKFADTVGVQETPTVLLYDRKAKTVTVYVGLDGTNNADGSAQYPGIRALAAGPPWAG